MMTFKGKHPVGEEDWNADGYDDGNADGYDDGNADGNDDGSNVGSKEDDGELLGCVVSSMQ